MFKSGGEKVCIFQFEIDCTTRISKFLGIYVYMWMDHFGTNISDLGGKSFMVSLVGDVFANNDTGLSLPCHKNDIIYMNMIFTNSCGMVST